MNHAGSFFAKLGNRLRQRSRRLYRKISHKRTRVIPNKILFEPLEPRLLLSADLSLIAEAGQALDLTARLNNQTQTVELVDNGTSTIVASQALADFDPGSKIIITGNDQSDRLRIDYGFGGTFTVPITFDGGAGNDTLYGPGVDSTWDITGDGVGSVVNVTFTGVEDLRGAPDNEDTFVFAAAGKMSGVVDGGTRGFDILSLSDGNFSQITHIVLSPNSGTIDRDGNVIHYDGLEPLMFGGTAANLVFDLTAAADHVILEDNAVAGDDSSRLRSVNGAFETTIFVNPADSLTINLGNGDDLFTIDALDLLFDADLTLNAGGDSDSITVNALTGNGSQTIDGGGGTGDILRISDAGDIILTDTSIQVDLAGVNTLALAGFEKAVLSGKTLDADGFSGQVAFTAGVPEWTSQGPGPLTGGQVRGITDLPVTGAIQDVAVQPFDLSSLYVATVGGGVWRNSDISVLFEFAEYLLADLTPEATARLTAFAGFLKANPSLSVQIVGHTDNVGGTVFNQGLSEDRADTVKQFLVNQGIDASRLTASGQGETEPVDANTTDAGRAHNRRVELIVNHWIPLTDQFLSLSVSALAISPRDADGNLVDASTPTSKLVLYAGTGSTSSGSALFNNLGAKTSIGILKSSDGGTTWTLLDQLAGSKVTSIQVLTGASPSGTLVVATDAAAGNGLFVSTDGGQSFTDVADARGMDGVSNDGDGDIDEADERVFDRAVSDLAQDPGNPLRVYAAVPQVGIFVSNDGGVTWAAANNAGRAECRQCSTHRAHDQPAARWPQPSLVRGVDR